VPSRAKRIANPLGIQRWSFISGGYLTWIEIVHHPPRFLLISCFQLGKTSLCLQSRIEARRSVCGKYELSWQEHPFSFTSSAETSVFVERYPRQSVRVSGPGWRGMCSVTWLIDGTAKTARAIKGILYKITPPAQKKIIRPSEVRLSCLYSVVYLPVNNNHLHNCALEH